MTDRQPRLFTVWLDAVDGSVASYDGIQWPDGTAAVHNRRWQAPNSILWTPESLARQCHGDQGRIEWAPDHAGTLAAVLEYLKTSDGDGIKTRETVLRILANTEEANA